MIFDSKDAFDPQMSFRLPMSCFSTKVEDEKDELYSAKYAFDCLGSASTPRLSFEKDEY